MVEKDEPKRDPAEQVEPQIASGGYDGGVHSALFLAVPDQHKLRRRLRQPGSRVMTMN